MMLQQYSFRKHERRKTIECFQNIFWGFSGALIDRMAEEWLETAREEGDYMQQRATDLIPEPLQRGRTLVALVEMKKTNMVIWTGGQSLLYEPLLSTLPPSNPDQSEPLHPPADGAVSTCLIIMTQLILSTPTFLITNPMTEIKNPILREEQRQQKW